MPRAGLLDPKGGSPWAGLACLAQGGSASQTLAPSCFSLASTQSWERGPCSPPGAGGLCSLAPVPGGRLPAKVQTRGSPSVSSGSFARGLFAPRGTRLGGPRGGGQRGACPLIPEPPSLPSRCESQESQDQPPQICVLGPCWGMGQGETRERMKDVEGAGQEVKRPAFVSKGQQAN